MTVTSPDVSLSATSGGRIPRWRRPEIIIALTALVVSALSFGWTLNGHFVGDDFGYVARFYEYPLARWPRLFIEGWAGGTWGFQLRELRPITALSFMVDGRIWEGNPFGYRLTNLILHTACAVLVGLMAWRVAGRGLVCGFGATVLFALHPAHAEAVQWITGRVDVLATAFYLAGFLAFWCYRMRGDRRWAIAAIGCYALAAFAKEFGLTLPLMFLAADVLWLRRGRQWREGPTWLPYLGCIAVVTIGFLCRRVAFGSDVTGAAWPDLMNVEFQRSFSGRQLTYVGHLFPPLERWLHAGAPWFEQHAVRTFLLIATILVAGLGAWRWAVRGVPLEERKAAVFFGLGWYLVATLPLVVTYVSARHLYLASAGQCVALALILHGLLRWRWVFGAAVVALAIFFAQRLSVTMTPWHTAAVVSGEIARELRALEPALRAGGALFVDVPEVHEGAYVWVWAVPFALRPPFSANRIDDRVVVLEDHGHYFDNARWHEQPAIAAMQGVEQESWILQFFVGRPPRRIRVSPDRVRVATAHFAAMPLVEFPHQSWRKFMDELSAP